LNETLALLKTKIKTQKTKKPKNQKTKNQKPKTKNQKPKNSPDWIETRCVVFLAAKAMAVVFSIVRAVQVEVCEPN
jgi:hypothetical protein